MPKSILLKNVPEDILQIILKAQSEEKLKTNKTQYSMESAIYKLIKNAKK